MRGFLQDLKTQRWDDHRYYHHSRINQSLHLLSALCFLTTYVTIFRSPTAAAMIGWLGAMVSRQLGHFFFEPKDYDEVNQATHAHKEAIKVGYNLRRKVVLLSLWGITPAVLWADPSFFGLFAHGAGGADFLRHLGALWLAIGLGALAFRTAQLAVQQSVQTGLVWLTKIITDPFHDVMLYWRSPLYLLRGELIDPMEDVLEEAPQRA